jgi:hypothetical protein
MDHKIRQTLFAEESRPDDEGCILSFSSKPLSPEFTGEIAKSFTP